MRAISITVATATLMAIIVAQPVAAQSNLNVRWEKGGIVRVSDGRYDVRFDLQEDIVGCVGQVYDRSTGERFGSGLRATRVLDSLRSGNSRFVLVSAVAAPNCNVQGRCGAGDDDVTLIWLQLADDLALVKKQVFAVEDCVYPRWVEGLPEDWRTNMKLSSGVIKLDFIESVYDQAAKKPQEYGGQVLYDRQNVSAGLQISRTAR